MNNICVFFFFFSSFLHLIALAGHVIERVHVQFEMKKKQNRKE
jgi:hypothetical protein